METKINFNQSAKLPQHMRFIPILLLSIFGLNGIQAQDDNYRETILKERQEKEQEMKNPETSPLTKADLKAFKGLSFFPVNPSWNVEATFTEVEVQEPFEMATSSGMVKYFAEYGTLQFSFNSEEYVLHAYQRIINLGENTRADYLFIPFTDLSNGSATYGAGRYIDLGDIPVTGQTIQLDFNQCYNPYCAYGEGFSCPIPPKENHLDLEVLAGEKQAAKD